jgi:GDP-L-fucose synthase
MILVTGAGGVLGSAFKKIKNQKFYFLNNRKELNLCSQESTNQFFDKNKFDGIIHLSAVSGGLGLSGPKYQATLLRDNTLMLFNILDNAVRKKIKKVLVTLSSGMYPPNSKMPYKEESIHEGSAHESSYGYFYGKRIFEPAIRSYRNQYNLDVIGCVPNGIFGENDNFSDHAPMLPSIIKKMYVAKKKNQKLEVWGDGSPLREYTYAPDLAKAFFWCFKNYSSDEIINVGSSEEKTIKEIVNDIAECIKFKKDNIYFNPNKPMGVLRKTMSNEKFIKLSKFKFTSLKDGIYKTCKWYEEFYKKKNSIKKYSKI